MTPGKQHYAPMSNTPAQKRMGLLCSRMDRVASYAIP